ncbi:MAG: helix-turn-helix domain-containing protein [Mycobacteriales bacterium]
MDERRLTDLDSVAALAEPVRRALYDAVVAAPEPLSRDAAAAEVGISRSLAAFHLDRLVDSRLLTATYRRLSGRTGPGAGRPSKLYERAAGEHAVSVPPRHYDLVAELLATAVESNETARDALEGAARRTGNCLAPDDGSVTGVLTALRDQGYEPRSDGERVVLANCPFHAIAQTHTALVCGANLALLEGFCDRVPGLSASLEPAEGRCCVVLRTKTSIS